MNTVTVILCATPAEFEALRQAFSTGRVEREDKLMFFEREHVVVVRGGLGRARAAAACELAIARWRPARVIDFGSAGALAAELRPGELVDEDRIATVEREIRTRAERAELARRTGAAAVTWETAGVEEVCRAHGIPFTSVRVITDVGEGEFTEEYESGVGRFLPPAARELAERFLDRAAL